MSFFLGIQQSMAKNIAKQLEKSMTRITEADGKSHQLGFGMKIQINLLNFYYFHEIKCIEPGFGYTIHTTFLRWFLDNFKKHSATCQ